MQPGPESKGIPVTQMLVSNQDVLWRLNYSGRDDYIQR